MYPVTTEALEPPLSYEAIIADFYDTAADIVGAHLDAGRDVAVICEGDPFFYGSYMYLHDRLAARYESEVVPGVCSMLGGAAVLGAPLVYRNQSLSVLSGVLPEDELRRASCGCRRRCRDETRPQFRQGAARARRTRTRAPRAVRRAGDNGQSAYRPARRSGPDGVAVFLAARRAGGKMARMRPPAIVILGAGALDTARRIQTLYAESQVHALQGRVEADVAYTELGPHLRELYARGTPIVALCAAGIVIRCVAPLLSNKGAEPPVLAVAEDGSAVVPLLGGLAGVNVMAREIAAALAIAPAITTSGELRFGTCVLNPPDGYALADIGQGKRFVSDLLAGESTRSKATRRGSTMRNCRARHRRGLRFASRRARGMDATTKLVIHPRSVVAAVTLEAVLQRPYRQTAPRHQPQTRTPPPKSRLACAVHSKRTASRLFRLPRCLAHRNTWQNRRLPKRPRC